MDLPDFWVPQYGLPSLQVLIYLVFLDVIFLISTMLTFYQSISRIRDSMKIEKLEKDVETDRVYRAIQFIDISLVLFPTNNLISHASGIYVLLAQKDPAYLFIGFTSLIHPFAFILFLVGMILLFKSLVSYNPFKIKFFESIATTILQFIVFLSVIIPPIFLIDHELRTTTILTQYIILVLSTLLLVVIIYLFWIQKNVNQIVRMRIIILTTMLLIFLLLIIIIALYVPDDTMLERDYLTRSTVVEYLIFSYNIFAFLEGALLYLFISLPIPLRELFGIARVDVFDNKEDHLDLESFHPWIHNTDIDYSKSNVIHFEQNSNYVIIKCFDKIDKRTDDLILTIENILHSTNLVESKIFHEEYFITYERSKSDMFIIGNIIDDELAKIFDQISEKFSGVNINFDDEVLKIDKFLYSYDGFEFALMISIPSLWSEARKLWILLMPISLTNVMENFMSNFYDYFDNLSDKADLFTVLRFPVENGEILDIPPSPDDLNTPHSSFLVYLGVQRG